jgi:hypothetical protein
MIATERAARQVPGGLFRTFAGPRCLPAPAREEAEQREHEDHDEDDPEDAHAISCLPFRIDCRPAWSDSAWGQRETARLGYVTLSVTRVALATASSPKVHQASAHRPPARRETRLANRPDYEGRRNEDQSVCSLATPAWSTRGRTIVMTCWPSSVPQARRPQRASLCRSRPPRRSSRFPSGDEGRRPRGQDARPPCRRTLP